MSRPQPAFGQTAFSNAAFDPSAFKTTPWNLFLGLEPTQAQVQHDKPDPITEYLKLFQGHKHDQSQPSESLPPDSNVLKVAPLFSGSVHATYNQPSPDDKQLVGQYGVLGMISDEQIQDSPYLPHQKLLYSNIEEPWSTFICGSQGSGKSHTLSCLLENNLLPSPRIGTLKTPLTGLVFHYDKFANFGKGQICEAAYLCAASNGGVPVQVLVAPTSLQRMTEQYHNLPGVPEKCRRPNVLPLYFSQEQLSVDTMMTLMAVNNDDTHAPLYISAIRQLLRDIAFDRQNNPGFNYYDFRQRLACLALTEAQNGPLMLRLQLLQSFLLEDDQTADIRAAFAEMWAFKPGTLTIVDLSDQFVSETDACALFSICLKNFMADWQSNPRIVALDEAHKFLTASNEATKLTSDLVSLIRQQRHLSTRVIVATQEPTISASLLDLCNVSIIHRFSSPKWYHMLRQHLAGACVDYTERDMIFEEIVKLSTGEALVFCPTAVLEMDNGQLVSLQDGIAKVRVRNRISVDGGQSMQASSRCNAVSNNSLPDMPQYKRFKGDNMPAPGSLVGKANAIAKQNLSSNAESTNTAQTAKCNASSAPVMARPSTTLTVTPRPTTVAASSNAPVVTPSSVPAVVPAKSTAPVQPPNVCPTPAVSRATAIHSYDIPKGHRYATTGVSEAELKRLMYQVVHERLDGKDYHISTEWLWARIKDVSRLCGVYARHLEVHALPEGCADRSPLRLMKRQVETYLEAKGIAPDDRCDWL